MTRIGPLRLTAPGAFRPAAIGLCYRRRHVALLRLDRAGLFRLAIAAASWGLLGASCAVLFGGWWP